MIVINFVCPICDACFTKSYAHVADQPELVETCPHCNSEIELNQAKVMEAASAHIVRAAVARGKGAYNNV